MLRVVIHIWGTVYLPITYSSEKIVQEINIQHFPHKMLARFFPVSEKQMLPLKAFKV